MPPTGYIENIVDTIKSIKRKMSYVQDSQGNAINAIHFCILPKTFQILLGNMNNNRMNVEKYKNKLPIKYQTYHNKYTKENNSNNIVRFVNTSDKTSDFVVIDTASGISMTPFKEQLVDFTPLTKGNPGPSYYGVGNDDQEKPIYYEGYGFLPIRGDNNKIIHMFTYLAPYEDAIILSAFKLWEIVGYGFESGKYDFSTVNNYKIPTKIMDHTIWVPTKQIIAEYTNEITNKKVRIIKSSKISLLEAHLRLNHLPTVAIQESIKNKIFKENRVITTTNFKIPDYSVNSQQKSNPEETIIARFKANVTSKIGSTRNFEFDEDEINEAFPDEEYENDTEGINNLMVDDKIVSQQLLNDLNENGEEETMDTESDFSPSNIDPDLIDNVNLDEILEQPNVIELMDNENTTINSENEIKNTDTNNENIDDDSNSNNDNDSNSNNDNKDKYSMLINDNDYKNCNTSNDEINNILPSNEDSNSVTDEQNSSNITKYRYRNTE
ncbi:hypothetical protein TBLA_0A00250 [Henningerozyma blattae CBS 6284]|uniref:Uncharacterized protein n=1 Tax=Henningerozyma blattae (strain ATCC 34711 / CBS 6284 / DSM 70876 / NBRC 10599 / NRRL Y-10934 / UCD 77-7) TaxID=1071380 RepID=I2GUM4_HENB6|nr:hypothetical protein TBLA_0A00250 [Tetrapisispora blattae CBS 6284]CCH57826.1 hypothetical protein TBLA_0A00250 [Tetrapisispora blattae CBS 6284]